MLGRLHLLLTEGGVAKEEQRRSRASREPAGASWWRWEELQEHVRSSAALPAAAPAECLLHETGGGVGRGQEREEVLSFSSWGEGAAGRRVKL